MHTIKISLIISTYNWVDALELALISALRQVCMPDEIIIADDGSGQETADLILRMQAKSSCPIVHVWHEDDGFRLAAIRNKAIAKASGDYIIQVDGDVILEKHFIADHMRISERGFFTTGSRVMMTNGLSQKVLKDKQTSISPFAKGVKDMFNALRFYPLTSYFTSRYKQSDPYYGKGCNMAFWRDDLIAVNAYNEDMTGWGKEDSELIVRLINYGKKKKYLKFGAVAYHLEHPLKSRGREVINTGFFERAIQNKTTWIENGLDQHLQK